MFCCLPGGPREAFSTMSEASRDEQTAKLLKRANEENEDSAEKEEVQATKKLKAEGEHPDVQATTKLKVEVEHADDEKKYPKKKVALLVAYSGKGYYGMQVGTEADSPLQALYLFMS